MPINYLEDFDKFNIKDNNYVIVGEAACIANNILDDDKYSNSILEIIIHPDIVAKLVFENKIIEKNIIAYNDEFDINESIYEIYYYYNEVRFIQNMYNLYSFAHILNSSKIIGNHRFATPELLYAYYTNLYSRTRKLDYKNLLFQIFNNINKIDNDY